MAQHEDDTRAPRDGSGESAELRRIERDARNARSLEELDRLRVELQGKASGDEFLRVESTIDARRVELAENRDAG